MLWSIDSCQNRVSADHYHMMVSLAQLSIHQVCVVLNLSATGKPDYCVVFFFCLHEVEGSLSGELMHVCNGCYVRTCVKCAFENKMEEMHERSLVSVKVEPRSISYLISTPYILPLFYLRD